MNYSCKIKFKNDIDNHNKHLKVTMIIKRIKKNIIMKKNP